MGPNINVFPQTSYPEEYQEWLNKYYASLGYPPNLSPGRGSVQESSSPELDKDSGRPQKSTQQLLYDYLLVVWGISQSDFDCGFEEYQKQLQIAQENKQKEVRDFVKKQVEAQLNKAENPSIPTNASESATAQVITSEGQKTNKDINKKP